MYYSILVTLMITFINPEAGSKYDLVKAEANIPIDICYFKASQHNSSAKFKVGETYQACIPQISNFKYDDYINPLDIDWIESVNE